MPPPETVVFDIDEQVEHGVYRHPGQRGADTERVDVHLREHGWAHILEALWPQFTAQADREGWPAARLLTALTEHEVADRARRRFQRRLGEARLPSGKTLDSFDFSVVPTLSKAHVMALCAGDRCINALSRVALHSGPWKNRNNSTDHTWCLLSEHQPQGWHGGAAAAAAESGPVPGMAERGRWGRGPHADVIEPASGPDPARRRPRPDRGRAPRRGRYLQPHFLVIDEVGYVSVRVSVATNVPLSSRSGNVNCPALSARQAVPREAAKRSGLQGQSAHP